MTLFEKFNDIQFGVGDRIRVIQKIKEGEKDRTQAFEGMVIALKGHAGNKSFTVRRIGTGQIGIERIFPLDGDNIEEVKVIKEGTKGVNQAKLYYTRDKSRREIDKIYTRANRRSIEKKETSKSSKKKVKK
jgi:large subunit ribosomal protein L19